MQLSAAMILLSTLILLTIACQQGQGVEYEGGGIDLLGASQGGTSAGNQGGTGGTFSLDGYAGGFSETGTIKVVPVFSGPRAVEVLLVAAYYDEYGKLQYAQSPIVYAAPQNIVTLPVTLETWPIYNFLNNYCPSKVYCKIVYREQSNEAWKDFGPPYGGLLIEFEAPRSYNPKVQFYPQGYPTI